VARTLILISWDGRSQPLAHIEPDATPDFDIMLFDYSGGSNAPSAALPVRHQLSQKTECKGQIFSAFHAFLAASPESYDYVALIDDDIAVSVSSLNGAIALAAAAALDSFSLSLTPDSFVNHRRFVQQPGGTMRRVPWVEVMMPFFRRALFLAAGPYFERSISSYGIDQFVMPMVCKTTGMDRVAVIDAFAAGHHRPVTSDGRIYSNGLTAHQERVVLRKRCLEAVKLNWPDLRRTAWFYQTFAPFNGPARFWLTSLWWPVHMVQRLVSWRIKRQDAAGMRNGPN
jgi:hypothetical protein